ncbi:MAG TPA: hypothetical protein VK469_11360 [Candidatus Kapabacteria bacterium]|nr:hypothetical protein [Candidatus Kapabacteria bacterium]
MNSQSVNDIMRLSLAERVRVIEILFQSLKCDLEKEREKVMGQSKVKPFKIRKFNLGREVHVE